MKTLHPFIHSGILADQRKAAHREQIAQLGIKAFDLVVCNLYPFQDTVASGASFDECVEQIDIGGPSMVRAAAKIIRRRGRDFSGALRGCRRGRGGGGLHPRAAPCAGR